MEFCAFLGNCADDYNDARMNRASSVAERVSMRNSLAEKSARNVLQKSIKQKGDEGDIEDVDALKDVEEGDEGKSEE